MLSTRIRPDTLAELSTWSTRLALCWLSSSLRSQVREAISPGSEPELTLLPGSSLAQIEEEGSLLRSKSYLGLGRLEVLQQSLLCNNNYFNILGGAQ